jgi:hypothetical protein
MRDFYIKTNNLQLFGRELAQDVSQADNPVSHNVKTNGDPLSRLCLPNRRTCIEPDNAAIGINHTIRISKFFSYGLHGGLLLVKVVDNPVFVLILPLGNMI